MKLIDKPQKYDLKTFNTSLNFDTESSKIVLTVRDLEFGYNNIPLGKTTFELYKGERLAIIGENGKGKSTLIKTLMNIIPKISGKFSYGYNVIKEYFDQQMEFINEENTIYDEYQQTFKDESPLQIRKTLGTFMFTGEDVFKQINQLSGGEKVRLGLCKILKKSPNLLLLDEPTNHLDIIGKTNLEDLLTSYEGTLLFVSHDRYFINKVATSLLIFEKNEIIYYRGTYQEYLEKKKETTNEIEKHQKQTIKKQHNEKPKNNTNQIRKIEKEIDKIEQEIKEIQKTMLDEEIYTDYKKMNSLQEIYDKLNQELEDKLLKWEELNS